MGWQFIKILEAVTRPKSKSLPPTSLLLHTKANYQIVTKANYDIAVKDASRIG